MKKEINWMRRGRTNVAGVGIPVRFYVDAGFEVRIKDAAAKRIMNVDPLPIPEFFDLLMRADGVLALPPLLKRGPAMASVTVHETMLDERRLEAVLKMTRKKRC